MLWSAGTSDRDVDGTSSLGTICYIYIDHLIDDFEHLGSCFLHQRSIEECELTFWCLRTSLGLESWEPSADMGFRNNVEYSSNATVRYIQTDQQEMDDHNDSLR